MQLRTIIIGLIGLATSFTPPDFKQENSKENLRKMMIHLHQVLTKQGDLTAGKKCLSDLLIKDEKRLRKALHDQVPAETISAILKRHAEMGGSEESLAQGAKSFCSAERSEVQVHAATTEELLAYAEGSVAFNEFPGGAKDLAKKILRPKMTFYEVEFVKPGEDKGMKYHLFYWDGFEVDDARCHLAGGEVTIRSSAPAIGRVQNAQLPNGNGFQ